MRTATRTTERELAAVVQAARGGDGRAWAELLGRFDGKLRLVARSYRLAPQDVDDVVQEAWVKLYESIDRIREDAAVGGWLTTTVRRGALRALQVGVRESLTDALEATAADDGGGPEAQLLQRERRVALSRAVAGLPASQRRLMTLIAGAADASYEQIGEALDMPIGSIGPTRARSLRRLQRDPELVAVAS